MLLSKGDILIPISLLLYFKEICADALVIGRYWKHLRRYIMVSIFIVTHKHKQEKRTANKKHTQNILQSSFNFFFIIR